MNSTRFVRQRSCLFHAATSGVAEANASRGVLCPWRWMSHSLLYVSVQAVTAWRRSSTVSYSSAHRHCSLRVRMNRSAQPLVSGSPM